MEMIKPNRLQPGDTIGVVSPSAGVAGLFPHRVEQAVKEIQDLGFRVKFAPHSLSVDGYVSASAKERAEDLMSMFLDSNVKAIIAAIGGNHSNQILKYLDFDQIKKNPKIFCGYSDNTVLHYALASQSNLCSFYGPCLVTQFGEFPHVLEYTKNFFLKALCNEQSLGVVPASPGYTGELLNWMEKKDMERARVEKTNEGYQWWRGGMAEADIFGGAIPSINHMVGTKYWVDLKDKVLFLDHPEGDNLGKGYSLSWFDSFLADLDNIGVFANIKGLIIGRAYNLSDGEIEALQNIVMKYVRAYSFPVLYNVNIGHMDPIMTLPLGIRVRLDSGKNLFEILESGVVNLF